MKKILSFSFVALFVSSNLFAAVLVDRDLKPFLSTNGETRRVILDMAPRQESDLPNRYDHDGVVEFLKARNERSREIVGQYVMSQNAGEEAQLVSANWINDSLTVDVTPEGLRVIARAPGVRKIYLDREISYDKPNAQGDVYNRPPSFADGNTPNPYDYAEIGLDKLRAELPQITGTGVVIGSVDTGVDGTHPALQGKIVTFWDGTKNAISTPIDYDTHGTHTSGTMVGGDGKTIKIGVAYGAKLMVAGALQDYDSMLKGMQFMLDPQQNGSDQGQPRAVNNSWNCGGAPDVGLFYKAISAWEAAGILPVFSAGNDGPDPQTITPPHEDPMVIATGSTGTDGKVSIFSSRGPGVYQGQNTQKPDLMAPGEKILSSVPGGGYEEMDGTSMASPHVTGSVALILQANPKLNPEQIRATLQQTLTPLDENGNRGTAGQWNANYGFGKLNVYGAVKLAMQAAQEMYLHGDLTPVNLTSSMILSPNEMAIREVLKAPAPLTLNDLESPVEFGASDRWISGDSL